MAVMRKALEAMGCACRAPIPSEGQERYTCIRCAALGKL